MDNCLDEILAMPWLAEDVDGAGGGVDGMAGVGGLGGGGVRGGGGLGGVVSLRGLGADESASEWAGGGGW